MPEDLSDSSDTYEEGRRRKTRRHPKRRKGNDGRSSTSTTSQPLLSLEPLFTQAGSRGPSIDDYSFDEVIEEHLSEFLQTRATLLEKDIDIDETGQQLRPLTRSEQLSIIANLTMSTTPLSLSQRITLRKLKLNREKRRAGFLERHCETSVHSVTRLSPPPSSLQPNQQVLDGLESIRTTPFEHSFLTRLWGIESSRLSGLIAVDWNTVTPWMLLMNDIRDHYSLSHPEREQPIEILAPITYTSLQTCYLPQIHDLLERTFWAGIDVTDSLEFSPERCTVVATFKKLVVGVAILSSPQETYITYLAVKAGWDKAQIARTMLYHLIMLNPNKDITLHVSVNNSAMLLYNRFGFKAEEFVAGFYEDYLDPSSRASKNAFRLRLRQL